MSSLFGQLCLLRITKMLDRQRYSLDSFESKAPKRLVTEGQKRESGTGTLVALPSEINPGISASALANIQSSSC